MKGIFFLLAEFFFYAVSNRICPTTRNLSSQSGFFVVHGEVVNGSFKAKGYDVNLSKLSSELLAKLEGKKVVMGYRPEHAVLHLEGKKEDYVTLSASIEVYEMLGDIQNVYLDNAGTKAIIKAAPEDKIKIGSSLEYSVAYGDLHFFDEKTEDAIE